MHEPRDARIEPQHAHKAIDALHLEPGQCAARQQVVIRAGHAADKGHKDIPAKGRTAQGEQRKKRDSRAGKDAPASSDDQGERNEHAKLRLEGEHAEKHSGEQRAAVEQGKCATQQARTQQPVLSDANAPEHGGRSEREKHRLAARQDGPYRGEINAERCDDPERCCNRIGKKAERRDSEKKQGRVEEGKFRIRERVAEIMCKRRYEFRAVIGVCGKALQCKVARRPECGEICRNRNAIKADEPDAADGGLSEQPCVSQQQPEARSDKQRPVIDFKFQRRNFGGRSEHHSPDVCFVPWTLGRTW
ncbi:MAG: hypothetical protein WA943_00250 [Parvibaculum sp.]